MRCILVSRRKAVIGLASAAAVTALAACTETASEFNAAATPRAKAPGVPVALVSLDGAPESVISRLSSAIAQQAARRDITIVGIDGKPRYQVRGYLSAQAGSDGKAELAWAFDIYDAQRKRAKRFSGQETASASGDGWAGLSDQDIQKVAFRALDDIAEFLAGTPEAVAARSGGTPRSTPGSQRAAGLLAGE